MTLCFCPEQRLWRAWCALLALVLGLCPALPALAGAVPKQPAAQDRPAAALLQFTSAGHVLGFAPEGVVAATGSHALRIGFVGANRVTPQAGELSAARPVLGQAGVAPPLTRVTYPNLWEGVTLRYEGVGIVRSTYHLAPYAAVSAIRLRYNRPVTVQADGTLRIAFETGTMRESAPLAWQELGGRRLPVAVSFTRWSEREIGFRLGRYDPAHPLFIDPTLTWHTFLGGSGADQGFAIAVDGSGTLYVAGYSTASWGTPVNAHAGSADVFVARLDSSGVLQWHTFLGGSGNDGGYDIAVDGSGTVYVAGYSTAGWGTPVNAHAGSVDAFVALLDSSGVLQWHTFLGGSGNDQGYGIAVDGSDTLYVAGYSTAGWGTPVNAHAGSYDVFVARLDSSGVLQWHTFLGGSNLDVGYGIAVDGSGTLYVAGESYVGWGTPVNPFAGGSDAFVAELDSSGVLQWHTFLGGSGNDPGRTIAVDGSGTIHVAGYSTAGWGTPVNPHAGSADALVVQISTDEVRPAVTINQVEGQADPTSSSPILFEVLFSEPVSGFDETDVSLSGTAGATTAVVTGGPTTYQVAVSGMSGSGTVSAEIAADVAGDGAGNLNTASTSTDNTVSFVQNDEQSDTIMLSSNKNGTVGGLRYRDEDILAHDPATEQWALLFDGSDVGLGTVDVDAFALLPNGHLLLSVDKDFTLAAIHTLNNQALAVDESDILDFSPLELGKTTRGHYSLYFDGSDVGLSSSGEDIDAIDFAADGSLLVSVDGSFSAPGASGKDEDLFQFSGSVGPDPTGSWSLYFDGSDVGLTRSGEDVSALRADHAHSSLYLATRDNYAVPGLSGNEDDIFVCAYSSLGETTACTFTLYWDGDGEHNFDRNAIDGLSIGPIPQPLLVAAEAGGTLLVDDTVELPGDDVDEADPLDGGEEPEEAGQPIRLFLPVITTPAR